MENLVKYPMLDQLQKRLQQPAPLDRTRQARPQNPQAQRVRELTKKGTQR